MILDENDPYLPSNYQCSDYQIEGYEWFSGKADATDQRFIIDLQHGTMDRLPDVRPFLYHVGYWHGDRSGLSGSLTQYTAAMVEDFFVKSGREYLLAEMRTASSGYFLVDRDWSVYNRRDCETMPYVACTSSEPLQGDVGFEYEADHGEDEDDGLIDCLVKTNLRAPLPFQHVTKPRPGDTDWDEFVRWLYSYQDHPAVGLVSCNWSVAFVHHMRIRSDLLKDWQFMKREAVDWYPSGD